MNPALSQYLERHLGDIKRANLYRQRRQVQGAHGVEVQVDGETKTVFCSNDYLGLTTHPELISAAQRSVADFGVGSGASQLVTGHNHVHRALEDELAEFTGRDRALYFATGTMTNMGVIQALVGKGDTVFSDALNHASLIDGIRLSGADRQVYAHADVEALQKLISVGSQGQRLLVSDAIFSMDGDIAPLNDLVALAQTHDAALMIDDAHGFGVMGDHGQGVAAQFDPSEIPVLVATLGKSAGVAGAFVAGSDSLIEYLIQRARSLIYTTAPPPALAQTARAALALMKKESWRRHRLHELIRRFRRGAGQLGITLSESNTPIQPLVLGDEASALRMSEYLWAAGIWVTAIRPPTVPVGSSRLRITLSAAHDESQVDRLLETLSAGLQRC